MTTLTINNVPDEKSEEIKEYLTKLGLSFQEEKPLQRKKALKEALLNLPVWKEEDLKAIEDAREAFNSIKPAKW